MRRFGLGRFSLPVRRSRGFGRQRPFELDDFLRAWSRMDRECQESGWSTRGSDHNTQTAHDRPPVTAGTGQIGIIIGGCRPVAERIGRSGRPVTEPLGLRVAHAAFT